jgi:phenylacetate-CoA ligase
MAGIAGRVGDAVKVRGLFVAPSQIKMIQAKLNGLPMQVVVSRTGHEDVLKLRIEKISPEIGSSSWEEGFKKIFREICTVGINNLEYLNVGEIKPEEKLIVDQRSW